MSSLARLLSPENPLLVLYEARFTRRFQKLALVGALAWALLHWMLFRAAAYEGLPLSPWQTLTIAWLVTVTLATMGFANWSCTTSLVSLLDNGTLPELSLTGLRTSQLLDSGCVFMARQWLRLTPLAVLAGALTGSPTGLAVFAALWLAYLPMAAASVYAGLALQLIQHQRARVSETCQWMMVTYGSALFWSLPAFALLEEQDLPTLAGCALVSGALWLLTSALYSRTFVCRCLERALLETGLERRPPAGRSWNLDRYSGNPILYRFERSRKHWQGQPLGLWLSLGAGLLAWLVASACPVLSVPFLACFLFIHGFCSGGALLRSLYEAERKRNLDDLLCVFSAPVLVQGLARSGYRPYLREVLVVLLALCAAVAGAGPEASSLVLSLIALYLVYAVVLRLASHISVLVALEARRRRWSARAWCSAPLLTYGVCMVGYLLPLFGTVMCTSAFGLNPEEQLTTYLASLAAVPLFLLAAARAAYRLAVNSARS